MKSKRFETILLKNTLAITVPAIAVFLLLVFMFARYPLFDQIQCNSIGNIENVGQRIEELHGAGTTNVKYTAKNLYYTGFDYYVDGEIEGAYYYMMERSCMLLFLIKTQNPQMTIDSITIKGAIVKDAVSAEHILNRLTAEAGMDSAWMRQYCCDYLISEPDYPYSFIFMVYVLFYSPIVICVLIFAYTLLVWLNPLLYPQSRQLVVYGEPGAIIEELNLQLCNRLKFRKNNIYITDDYMIVSYLMKTDVIRLDYIRYLSKNLVEGGHRFRRHGDVYRLTMSNPDKLFYEVDFNSEELIDEVVAQIREEPAGDKKKLDT